MKRKGTAKKGGTRRGATTKEQALYLAAMPGVDKAGEKIMLKKMQGTADAGRVPLILKMRSQSDTEGQKGRKGGDNLKALREASK